MKILFLISSCFFFISVGFANTVATSLEKLKEAARRNNFQINASKYEALKYEMIEKESSSSFYPRFGIEGEWSKKTSENVSHTNTVGYLYTEYNLFNGFRDLNRLKKSKLTTDIYRSHLREKGFDLNIKIERLFFEFLYLKKQYGLMLTAVKRNKRHIKLIKKRLSSGLVTKTDLLEFELKGSKLTARANFLKLRQDEVRANLIRSAGITKTDFFEPTGEIPHYQLEETLENLLVGLKKDNELLKRSKLILEESSLGLKISKSSWMPKVGLEAKYGYLPEEETGFSSDNTGFSVALKAKWELFSGFSSRYGIKRSQHEKAKSQFELKQKIIDALSLIEVGYRRLISLQNRISLEELNEKKARELYNRTLKEYRRGIKDSGALASAGDQLTEIKEQIYQFKNLYIESKLNLEKLLGKELRVKRINHGKEP